MDNRTEDMPQVRSKGGRKAIHTPEQRKQRNRAAQAAFRERRIEYIKELEDEAALRKADLRHLQAAHSRAAEECLMLRYKNSLLERILSEKGIDVQQELRRKGNDGRLISVTSHGKRKQDHEQLSQMAPKRAMHSSRRPPPSSSQHEILSPPSTTHSPLTARCSPISTVPRSTTAQSPVQAVHIGSSSQAQGRSPYISSSQSGSAAAQPLDLSLTTAEHLVQKLTPSKEAAAYYLSSFLSHIEKLESMGRATHQPSDLVSVASQDDRSNHTIAPPHTKALPDCQFLESCFTPPCTVPLSAASSSASGHQPSTNIQDADTFERLLCQDMLDLDTSLQFPGSAQFGF